MLYIILAILIFGVLIATHELGHFATAKLLGVKVNEFSIGMGPAVFKREKGETSPWAVTAPGRGRTTTRRTPGPLAGPPPGRRSLSCAPGRP